jgi:hypothetical protein
LGLHPGSDQPRLYDAVVGELRTRHYSRKSEQAYVHWIRRFIVFHQSRHPAEIGAPQVSQFLTHLAVAEHVGASTQNQALNGLVFLYKRACAANRACLSTWCEPSGRSVYRSC